MHDSDGKIMFYIISERLTRKLTPPGARRCTQEMDGIRSGQILQIDWHYDNHTVFVNHRGSDRIIKQNMINIIGNREGARKLIFCFFYSPILPRLLS